MLRLSALGDKRLSAHYHERSKTALNGLSSPTKTTLEDVIFDYLLFFLIWRLEALSPNINRVKLSVESIINQQH